jgi:parallel beta-helix repeat protein
LGGKYVINISSDFVNINGFTIQNNYVDLGSGIYIDSNNNFISDNNIKNNTNGIFINSYSSYSYSNSNNICNNIIEDNRFAGIYAYRLIYTNITANTISGNKNEGICIRDSSNNNIISKNIIIKNNGIGIYLMFYSKNNNFCNNTISNNSGGITLQFNCNYNKIFRNNFINNTYNNANDYCTNTWYNLTITEGNYWSDYSEKYPNATGSNGIWDMPYNITGGENQDKYPLMRPYS